MSKRTHTSAERWSQFLSFIIVWVPAVFVGTALVFWATGGFEPRSEASEPDNIPEVSVPEVAEHDSMAPANADPIPRAAAPEPPPQERSSHEPVRDAPVQTKTPRRRAAPASRQPARPRMSASERTAKVASHIRAGASASEAGDYAGAVASYERALELDPNNFEVKILMSQVESLDELAARQTQRQFQESATELTAEGTPGVAGAVELIIELLPAAPNPGDPYILRVRAHNASNDALGLQSVELTETHESMKRERGRLAQPLAKRLGPKETALLWERSSDWAASDRSGTIAVALTLANGSQLSKSLRW